MKHPDEIKQAAYERWILEAGRNHAKVVRLIQEEFGYELSEEIIRYWAKHEEWSARYLREMEQMFPYTRKETAANLVIAGLLASRKLLGAMNGDELERGADKLIFGSLDRAGFSPVGQRDPVAGTAGAGIQQSSLIEKMLSPEDLAQIAAEAADYRPVEEEAEGDDEDGYQ